MAIGQRIRKATQRAARQRTKRVQARQEGRTERRATRQAGRTQRQATRQRGRTERSQAKAMGGRWSPGTQQARWGAAADIAGAVAPIALGGMGISGTIPEMGAYDDPIYSPTGNGNGNGNGAGWWGSQSQPMQIGIAVAAAAGLWFLLKKK